MKNLKMTILLILIGISAFIIIKYANDSLHYGQDFNSRLNLTENNNNSKVADSCENFAGIEKAKCYLDSGNLNASLEVCGNLSGGEMDECYGRTAIRYALDNSSSDVLTCVRIQDTDALAFCYSNIAAIVVKNNLTRAKEICNKSDPVELCYAGIARVFARENPGKSLDICKSIDGNDECYISLASVYMKENMSLAIEMCGNVTSCREMLAPKAAELNPDTGVGLCGGYPCIMGVAQVVARNNTSKAIEICKTIGHPVPRSQCEYFILPQVLENQPRRLGELCGDIMPFWDNVQQLAPYCNAGE